MRFNDFVNLLAAVNTDESERSPVSMECVLQTLSDLIMCLDESSQTSNQMLFLFEQIELLSKQPSGRGYSKNLNALSLLSHSHSPS